MLKLEKVENHIYQSIEKEKEFSDMVVKYKNVIHQEVPTSMVSPSASRGAERPDHTGVKFFPPPK